MKTSAPASASSAEPRCPSRVRQLRVLRLGRRSRLVRPRVDARLPGRSRRSSRDAGGEQDLRDRDAGRADARARRRGRPRAACRRPAARSAARRGRRPPCRAGRRGRRGCRARSRSRRSISKQRGAEMSSRLIPPKPGAIAVDGRDDLVHVLRVEADRQGVDAAELLEQHRLALHHRQRRLGADVAEPEHGRAVGDDGDRVLLDREVPDLRGVLGDRRADAGDARRVRHREVVARLQRDLRGDLDLAAEVQQEGAVGDVLDLDAVERADGGDDRARCAPASVASTVTSRTFVPRSTRTRSIAPSSPPASPIAWASRANEPGRSSRCTRSVALNCAER